MVLAAAQRSKSSTVPFQFPQLTPTQNSSAQGRDTGQRWRAELQWNSTRDQPIPRLLRRRHALKILNLFEPMKLTMKSPKCMVEKYNFSPTKLSFYIDKALI